jgi:hypothetical protein
LNYDELGGVRMLRVLGVLVLVAMYISFIIDVLRTPRLEARTLPKMLWLALVVLIPLIGGILWFFLGRPRPTSGGLFRRRGPIAPDDDPKFLKGLDEEAWRRRMRERRGEA